MKNRLLSIGITLFAGILICLAAFNMPFKFNFKSMTVDSGFDSSWDSGSSDSSYSSSSDFGDSSSSSGGRARFDEEWEIWENYFSDGFSLKNYFSYVFSFGYIAVFLGAAFFHLFMLACLYATTYTLSKKTIITSLLVPTIIYFIFPTCLIVLLDMLIAFIMAYKVNRRDKKRAEEIDFEERLKEIDLSEYALDSTSLHEEIYDIYVKVQEAWMDFKLDDVKDVLGNDIYNMYKKQLATLSAKKEQNIMSDFNYVDCAITKVDLNKDTYIIYADLIVTCKDYLINTKNKKVVRGEKDKIHKYYYALTFEKSKTTDVNKCPNCDALLDSKGKTINCTYCGSVITRQSANLVLIKKSMYRQQ